MSNNAEKLVYLPHNEPTEHSTEEMAELISLFTTHKQAEKDNKRLAYIFNGTVGAGKTMAMRRFYKNLSTEDQQRTAYCAYDEHGFLLAMKKYREEISALRKQNNGLAPHHERMQIRDKYQADTQYGFALLQQEALKNHFNILIDMTMQSPNALRSLKPYIADNREIILHSHISPKAIAKERVASRLRSLWPEEFESKYDNWFANFENLAKNVPELILHNNPEDGKEPEYVAHFKNGQLREVNEQNYDRMVSGLSSQAGHTQTFLKALDAF